MADDAVQRTPDSLGELIYTHKPSKLNMGAGIVLGLLCFGGAIGLSVFHLLKYSRQGEQELAMYLLDWLGVVILLGGGIALLWWTFTNLSFSLFFCDDGFYFTRGNKTHVFAWEDIVEVHETVAHESTVPGSGIVSVMAPKRLTRSYRIKRRDGMWFKAGANLLPEDSLFGEPLKKACNRHGVDWHVREIFGVPRPPENE